MGRVWCLGSYIGDMLVEYRRPAFFPVPWGPWNKRFEYRETSAQIYGLPKWLAELSVEAASDRVITGVSIMALRVADLLLVCDS